MVKRIVSIPLGVESILFRWDIVASASSSESADLYAFKVGRDGGGGRGSAFSGCVSGGASPWISDMMMQFGRLVHYFAVVSCPLR